MKNLALVFLLSALLSGDTTAQQPGDVPDVLYMGDVHHSQADWPDWVIASKVLTPTGEVDSQLFSPEDQEFITTLLSREPEGGCIRLGVLEQIERAGAPRRPDLPRAVRNSDWVFVGQVTARAEGFHRRIPGTLLRIHPSEIIKGPTDRISAHFIFMPIATFDVGGTRICKTHPVYADLPEIGEEVLLFIDLESTWHQQGEFLWTDGESGIVTIHRNTGISFPRNFLQNKNKARPTTRSELLRQAREALRSGN
jgi:hypothetical protein